MATASPIPAKSVIAWYLATEQMLDDVLKVVPYCPDHRNVWSPALVTILLETCSQLDSLWLTEARRVTRQRREKFEVKNYFTLFGKEISGRWAVFWGGEEPEKIRPFGSWASGAGSASTGYVSLRWWAAYNKVKHDRLRHRQRGTLEHAVSALAALFLAILRCESCHDAVIRAGWLSGLARDPGKCLSENDPDTYNQWIVAESKLFSYPVGFCRLTIPRGSSWDGPASSRFQRWWAEHEHLP